MWVITGREIDTGEILYWSNGWGWISPDIEDATTFGNAERMTFGLPECNAVEAITWEGI